MMISIFHFEGRDAVLSKLKSLPSKYSSFLEGYNLTYNVSETDSKYVINIDAKGFSGSIFVSDTLLQVSIKELPISLSLIPKESIRRAILDELKHWF